MKVCPLCSHQNDDSAALCAECQYPLPSSKSSNNKKKNGTKNTGGKPAFIPLIAGALVAAAVVSVASLGFSVFSPKGKLTDATKAIGSAFMDNWGEQSGLTQAIDSLDILDDGKYHSIELMASVGGHTVEVDVDCARNKGLMTGALSYANAAEGYHLDTNFYVDKKDVRFVLPGVVSDVYGFSIKDFNKRYEKSAMRKVLGLPSADKIDFSALTSLDIDKLMKQPKKLWDRFYKTLKVENFGERPMTINGVSQVVQAYDVSWDARAMEKLVKSISGKIPSVVSSWLPGLEPDCRCFVNKDGVLVGVDFVTMGKKCTLLLEGASNPWDSIRLEVLTLAGSKSVFTGDVTYANNNLSICLSDEIGNEYGLNYNGDTGKFQLNTPDGILAQGVFFASDSSLMLGYTSSSLEQEAATFLVAISKNDEKPETLKTKYVDLLDMNLKEWQRFLIEVLNSNG